MGQLSFFSADAHPRALTDLEGVLCARGQVVMFGRGTTARLSIVLGTPPVVDDPDDGDAEDADSREADVRDADFREADSRDAESVDADPEVPDVGSEDADPRDADSDGADAGHDADSPATAPPVLDPVVEWRAHALCCAFSTRGVDAEIERLDDGRPVVRSAYRSDLVGVARAWTRGAVKAAPAQVDLDGPRLRLWVFAAGRQHGPAYLLGLDPHATGTHEALLAASRRAGLGATLGGDRAEPVLRIVGRRRQARLAELIGARPASLVDGIWPS